MQRDKIQLRPYVVSKVGLISLGCDKNRVDSELILGLLSVNGYEIVSSIQKADIIVINTCGFIADSKSESINTILEIVAMNKKVVVTGCLVERYLEDLKKEIPEVALWIPIRDYRRFNEVFQTIDKNEDNVNELDYRNRLFTTQKNTAYLRIGEGCSNHCTYCAIPLIRGEYISRPLEDIVEEAEMLAELGKKEITLLEQDTTKYGSDFHDGTTLVTLLQKLVCVPGIEHIRLLYLYPDEISDELIDFIAKNPLIYPYFDIPIQHSEDRILKLMNRRGDKKLLKELVNKIRTKIPNCVLRTTVMVGFPSETEEEFSNLLAFMKEIKFDHLGAFAYSQEEDTPSYSYPEQIPEEVKNERLDKLMKTQQRVSYQVNKKHLGEIMDVLITGKEENYYVGRSYWNAPDDVDGKIFVKSNRRLSISDEIKVKITDTYVYDLLGEEVE
ncbi:MAG: 30S ribosomal protein S12 methylthiotransferase RimO [Bacilli bacterium]|nr:30S ribosomal protein S12 methylthiotransferase RimO [Bacilli bacterium]